MEWLDSGILIGALGRAFEQDVVKWGLAFSLAAWFHSGRVKKEIKTQFSSLTDAIKEMGAALRQDMAMQAQEIKEVKARVSVIEENQTKGEEDVRG